MRLHAIRRATSREEWLASRGVGASDVAAILGLSHFRTAYDVWATLTGRVPPTSTTPAMSRGHRWEPIVLALYTDETKGDVRRPPPYSTYVGEDGWSTATPDAIRLDGKQPGLVEAKTDAIGRWGESCTIERWGPDAAATVRADYAVQAYWQMHVLDAPYVDLVVLLPYFETRTFRLLRDDEVIDAIVETVGGFRDRYIVGSEEPAPDGSDSAALLLARQLGATAIAPPRTATVSEVELAIGYERARRAEDAAKLEKRRLGQLLVQSAGEASRLDLAGSKGRVTVVRNSGRLELDEKALLTDHPELDEVLAPYRHRTAPSIYPRISGLEAM